MAAAAVMAILGGAAMSLLVLYAIVYQPLHYHDSLNYGESLWFGDVLAFGSGLAAIAIGVISLRQRSGSRTARGIAFAIAGGPTLILALLWSFPETFHLSIYPTPFYLARVYFADVGIAHVGDGYMPVPLLIACAAVVASGVIMASPSAARVTQPADGFRY
jgi:hypothetical protein